MINKKKFKSNSQLQKTLDKYFSYYIRLRSADENGMVTCVTCGKRLHWKEADCGHFRTRNKKIHRFNEKNCNIQCTYCNQFLKGEQYKHGQYIDKKYGEGFADYLTSTENQICKRNRVDFEFLIAEYKQKAKVEAERINIKL